MAAVRLDINGATLRWARNLARISVEELGRAAGVSGEQITKFELGDQRPTYSQVRKLAQKLDRPVAFLLVEPPEISDIPETLDFRGHDGTISAKLARELKRAEAHRQTLIDLEGVNAKSLALLEFTKGNLEQATANARHILGIESTTVPPVPFGNQSFNYWRGLLENAGILVFQTTGIGLQVFRGLSVFHKEFPIILLNGGDSSGGRTFTLFHELAHIANRTSGLCLLEDSLEVEFLCNAFSAEFLMPRIEFQKFIEEITKAETVGKASRHFRVSKLAAAIRLKSFGVLTEAELEVVRKDSEIEWQIRQKKISESDQPPPPSLLRMRDLGPTYTSTVFRALESGRINLLDATYFLNAKVPTIEKMFDGYRNSGG